MTDIEIPWAKNRSKTYRFFEKLPGIVTYTVYALPAILSFIAPTVAAYFIITYVLVWIFKSMAMSVRVLQGYRRLKSAAKQDWVRMSAELRSPAEALAHHRRGKNKLHNAHIDNLQKLAGGALPNDPGKIIHAVMIATYNEPPEIIHPTIEYVLSSHGVDQTNTAFFLAYEERGGDKKRQESLAAIKKYGSKFAYAEAVEHVLQDDETRGKGANASFAGRKIAEWAEAEGIDPARVLVTVLDADNRPDKNYFAALEYTYLIAPDRKHKSYQPVALYVNNVWDVPAVMRLSAMANTYFHTANSMRLHALRNFSAHAQSLDALIETDFWSVRTIVEDGHQFWRSYFAFDGNHEVLPIYAPIYQDAVYAGGYKKTLIAQFKQIRRWTYGASDIAYVATKGLKNKKVPRSDLLAKFARLFEGHVGWATSAPLLLLSGWVPLFIARDAGDNIVAQQLPQIIGRINTFALVLVLVTMYIGIATLPPRPLHHKKRRYTAFFWQWLLLPLVGIVFNSYASLTSQTRLLFGKYIEDFVVTEKVVKKQ